MHSSEHGGAQVDKMQLFHDGAQSIVADAVEAGYIQPRGDLMGLLNIVITKVTESPDTEINASLLPRLTELHELTQDIDVQAAMPFFGIEVVPRKDGGTDFIYAD